MENRRPKKSRPKLSFYCGKTSCLRNPPFRRRPKGDQPANHKRRPQRKVIILWREKQHVGVRSISVIGWLFRASTRTRISQTCCFTTVKRQFRLGIFGVAGFPSETGGRKNYGGRRDLQILLYVSGNNECREPTEPRDCCHFPAA